jgi:hypothetical protein
MKRYISFLIAALIGGAVMMLQPVPASAQDEGDYADTGGDYGADGYGPRDNGDSKYDRPYLAYSYTPKYKPRHDDYQDAGYKPPYSAYANGHGNGHGNGYGNGSGSGYDSAYAAGYGNGHGYANGYGYKKRYPKWRKTCVYGPLREKKICDYEPRQCWKERECYYIYGKKYCRYYTKCSGGGRVCSWIKKPYYGHGCNRDY